MDFFYGKNYDILGKMGEGMKNFQFKKKFGQNFLKDQTIPAKIVGASKIPEDTLVIEIGPGAGVLTQELAKVCKQVLAYEVDTSLEDILSEKLYSFSNVNVVFEDFLSCDFEKDLADYQFQYLYVIANLPYYITTPILMRLVESKVIVDKIVIMVQKEVGERFCAEPKTKDYSSITVFLNYYFEIQKLFSVNRNCFVPKPNVDSVILSFSRKKELLPVVDFSLFSRLVRDSFQYKRKNLKNNLRGYNLSVIESVLHKFHYQLTDRAEVLPLEVFVEMSNKLGK